MSKFTARILASTAAVALGASLVPTAAFAKVTPLGNLDPDSAGSYNETAPKGAISVEGTFELTEDALTALSATIAVNTAGMYKPGVLELLEGATVIKSVPLVLMGNQYTASFSTLLGPATTTPPR